MSSSMKILIINSSDIGGGAEKIAVDLHSAYLESGLDSKLVVGKKKSSLSSVYEIPTTGWFQFWNEVDSHLLKSQIKGAYRLHKLVKEIKAPHCEYARKMGIENYHYPESRRLIRNLMNDVDIIHMHNLHNEYFDMRMLPSLSKKKPILITMHDEYLFTGHCAYTLGCERWKIGCGDCPHLETYPSVKRDNTRFNWNRKQKIFAKSQLSLVAPSAWLAERARQSLLSHLPVRVIPNGIDLSVFKPGSQKAARAALSLDLNAFIILYTAVGGRVNQFKDYEMLDRLVLRLQAQKFDRPVILLAVGGHKEFKRKVNDLTMIEKSYVTNAEEMSSYYQACNLYIHTAKADNAPLVILEAMACGKPVLATNAGGIPELVREGVTGFTVPVSDDEQMALKVLEMVQNPDRLRLMGLNAAEIAKNEYGLDRMVQNYLDLYHELTDERNEQNAA